MTLQSLIEISLEHSDFVKEEDKDKLKNLISLAYNIGYIEGKKE